eukprot:gene3274-4101_t
MSYTSPPQQQPQQPQQQQYIGGTGYTGSPVVTMAQPNYTNISPQQPQTQQQPQQHTNMPQQQQQQQYPTYQSIIPQSMTIDTIHTTGGNTNPNAPSNTITSPSLPLNSIFSQNLISLETKITQLQSINKELYQLVNSSQPFITSGGGMNPNIMKIYEKKKLVTDLIKEIQNDLVNNNLHFLVPVINAEATQQLQQQKQQQQQQEMMSVEGVDNSNISTGGDSEEVVYQQQLTPAIVQAQSAKWDAACKDRD